MPKNQGETRGLLPGFPPLHLSQVQARFRFVPARWGSLCSEVSAAPGPVYPIAPRPREGVVLQLGAVKSSEHGPAREWVMGTEKVFDKRAVSKPAKAAFSAEVEVSCSSLQGVKMI